MRADRGMGLVDVLVAVTLLAVGALITIGLVSSPPRTNRASASSLQHAYAVQEKMDELLALNQRLPTIPSSDEPLGVGQGVRTWVGQPDPNGHPDLQMVVVRMQWREQGVVRAYELKGLVSP